MSGHCPALTSDLGDILSEHRSSCQGAKQKQNVNGGTWHSLLILEFRFKKKQQIIFSIYLEFKHCPKRLSSDQTGQKLCCSTVKLAAFLLFLCVWRRSRSMGKSSSGLSWGPVEQGQVLLAPFWFGKLSHFSWCYYCKWSERSGNYDRSVWMSKEMVQKNSVMK